MSCPFLFYLCKLCPTRHTPRIVGCRTRWARLKSSFAREIAVEGEAPRQLRVKDRYQDIRRFGGGDKIIHPEKDLNPLPRLENFWCANEGERHRVLRNQRY